MSALQEGVRQVSDEAAGVLSLQVIQRGDMPALISDALSGSGEAMDLLRLVRETMAGIQAAPRRKPMLCGCCPKALRDGRFSVVLAKPDRADASQGVAMMICARCGQNRGAIQAAALVALRRIWPDCRPITITHPGGGRA